MLSSFFFLLLGWCKNVKTPFLGCVWCFFYRESAKIFSWVVSGQMQEKSSFRVFLGTSAGRKHRSRFFVFFFERTEAQKSGFWRFWHFIGAPKRKNLFFVFLFCCYKKNHFWGCSAKFWNFARLHRLRTRPGHLPDTSRTPPGHLLDTSQTPPGHFCPNVQTRNFAQNIPNPTFDWKCLKLAKFRALCCENV